MATCRANDESEKTWYRSERFFLVNGEWYFSTRENIDIGPFNTIDQARLGLERFIINVQKETCSKTYAARIATNGEWATTLYH